MAMSLLSGVGATPAAATGNIELMRKQLQVKIRFMTWYKVTPLGQTFSMLNERGKRFRFKRVRGGRGRAGR